MNPMCPSRSTTVKSRSKGSMHFLEGYILPEKEHIQDDGASGDDSEVDDEEDTTTTEFLDMEEMSNSSSVKWVNQSSVPSRRKVLFKTFSGDEYRVTGRFALKSPWWHIACNTQGSKKKMTIKGSAWYKIRTDLDKDEWAPIVSLFLVACDVPQESVKLFFDWLTKERYVAIGNLLEVLTEFRDNDDSGVAQQIINIVSASVEGRRVRASFSYPRVMKYLPVLLPRQFHILLARPKSADGAADVDGDHVDCLLAKLEVLIKGDVWKLGFSDVMLKELDLVRCEAKLEAFKECGLLEKMPRLQRNALWVYHEVKRFCTRTGSTYMKTDTICEALRGQPGIPDDQVWEALPFLQDLGVVVCDNKKVVLQKLHKCEAGIAESLRYLVNAKRWTIPINAKEVLYACAKKKQMAKIKKDPTMNDSTLSPVKVDPDQLLAAEMICANPVTVISGKGGCGKTTVVSVVFQAAVEQKGSILEESAKAFADIEDPGEDPGERTKRPYGDKVLKEEILLTAPTGRAASLLTKKTGFKAYTLHQVIWKFNSAKAENGLKQWPFGSVRVLVLDEGSLVPVGLLHDVLSMLIQHAKLQKFVILGDVRQLPSIQPGNTLHDLFDSLTVVNSTVEMMSNHRSEAELIVKNAQLIADIGTRSFAGRLNFDHVVDLHGPFNIPRDKSFIHIRLPDDKGDDDLQNAIRSLVLSAPGLDDHSTSQFIAFRRADVDLINELCCTHYNKHTTKDHQFKLKFQPGDKVCVTKNAFIDQDAEAPEKLDGEKEVETQRKLEGEDDVEKQERIRLCNGEIFFITQDNTKIEDGRCVERLLTLDDKLGRTVKAHYRSLLRDCKLRHAWARTIHTFQGSESETVVYIVGAGGGQTWRHVYTAVTRGQKRVYVVSTNEALERALKWRETPRLTRLAGLVKKQVVQLVQSSPHLQRDRRGLPKFTPQKSSPQAPPRQTPGRSQAASCSTAFVPKRLWEAEGAEEAPGSSPMKDNLDVKQGTARIRAAAASASGSASAKTESGTPHKKTKVSSFDSPTGCTSLQQLSLGSPQDPLKPNKHQSPK
ncbi:unnamed protein product [Lota lota]